jgi:hypothetical protein
MATMLVSGRVKSAKGALWARAGTRAASLALALGGAATVIAGAAMPWATFYRGLVERNGLAGDGAYMVGLAAAAALAAAFSMARTLAPLRWVSLIAGAAVVAIAVRDLRNIHELQGDPAAAAYFVDAGDGLLVVIAGGALLAASAVLGAPLKLERGTGAPILLALMCVAAAGLLVAGGIGEYHLHLASGGHAEHHASVTQPAHVLTILGGVLAIVAWSLAVRLASRRRAAGPGA